MSASIPLRRPGVEVGVRHEIRAVFGVEPFELYGRYHEIAQADATVGVTRLAEGLHLDLRVRAIVRTTCDRTLEPTELLLEFGDSEFLSGPNDPEMYVEDWELNVSAYTREALPSEVPLQVFCTGTQPVEPESDGDDIDPRWQGLEGIFASGSKPEQQ